MAGFVFRYFFDLGSGVCLWSASDQARERWGYPVDHRRLGLDPEVAALADRTIEFHDGSIDWNDPGGPSPWTEEDEKRFREMSDLLLARLREALGEGFEIIDQR